MKDKVNVFWFRRDLRLEDNVGLSKAMSDDIPVVPVFIFDTGILDKLPNPLDIRVDYIHQALQAMQHDLEVLGSTLQVFHDTPKAAFEQLLKQFDIQGVFCNTDYEPQAIQRDEAIAKLLNKSSIDFHLFKDQVIFEKEDVQKNDGTPYTVYTPYSKKWRAQLERKHYTAAPNRTDGFYQTAKKSIPSLKTLGFEKTELVYEKPNLTPGMIDDYDKHRDFPAEDRTTRMGVALRFGTISIRECVKTALKNNDTWLSELIWREFFMQILYHFPHVVDTSFKKAYDAIPWRNNEKEFARWCKGETGYPIVDAGMRQLNETGFMHNRVRMVVASFLCKHLLIDWRWGEAYFAEKLLDYELSSNNGNWQWAAGCGCDAAPYFRVFNPDAQTKRFDKDLAYIKRWNPSYSYRVEQAIVDHKEARERVLKVYKKALNEARS
ncbi:DNA photolyase family protein [Sphingobacterium sp. lm-10]|uniref:cryptochrome/photolyase family protein n=1 Tax=Sphingobacterium sp. lm-10 TaxID=2944904 RepID=UPI002020A7B2|nr:deoxyribodipyrimidine photo-lyase [Sphingobacterium sp. lm-10]MCL7986899.1 DNA photolyase family protein [Sphingobacterium sp. lm-10]